MLEHQSVAESEILRHMIVAKANYIILHKNKYTKLILNALKKSKNFKKDVLRRNYCEDSNIYAYILYILISINNRIICFKRMSVIHMIYIIYTKMFAKLLRRADFKISALNSKDIDEICETKQGCGVVCLL